MPCSFTVFVFLALVEKTLNARWIFSQHNYVVSQWSKLRSFPIWSPSNVIALPLFYCTFLTKIMSGRDSIWINFSLLLTYFCFFVYVWSFFLFVFLLKFFLSAWCNLPQYVKHLFVFLIFVWIFQQCKMLTLFVTGKAVDWMDLPVLNLLDVIFKWIFIKRKNVLIANLSCGFNGNDNRPKQLVRMETGWT